MCSSILNILYIVALTAGAGLTIGSLVTPAWRHAEGMVANATWKDTLNLPNQIEQSVGLFTNQCNGDCEKFFMDQPTWKKVTLATMILSLGCCAAAFVWSCIACFMCCCKSCLTPPLPILSGIACILDIIGVTVAGVKSGEQFDPTKYPTSYNSMKGMSDFGYSMWLGIGACVVLAICTVIGIVLAKVSKVSPV